MNYMTNNNMKFFVKLIQNNIYIIYINNLKNIAINT